jgi:hypothetical protein
MSAATMEISMEDPQKTENGTAIPSSDTIPGYRPKGVYVNIQKRDLPAHSCSLQHDSQ